MIAKQYIQLGNKVRLTLKILELSPSSFYKTNVAKLCSLKKGVQPSTVTLNCFGERQPNESVVNSIKELLSREFIEYGYLKVTHYLQDELGLIINKKKVYRLMLENKLLLPKTTTLSIGKKWVTKLVPEAVISFSYWEFDIKFMYVNGKGYYYPLLSVIDVKSRWLLGHMCQRSIKKEDVKVFMKAIITTYKIPEKITIRNDNGSQFESNLIKDFFAKEGIEQEFTKPATPEQNAHIESYHSILESTICRKYEFKNEPELKATLARWAIVYNYERIHSGCNYLSPYKNLLENGISVAEKFCKQKEIKDSIFIALNEKETSSAEEQLVRDNLVDRNNSSLPK